MTAEIIEDASRVPIDGGQDVQIFPGDPWPSPYRGSKYSVLNARGGGMDKVLQWQYKDLRAQVEPPEGLIEVLQDVGKSGGAATGSIRVTAGREVLTKVHTDNYPRVEEAPLDDGWVPVYLGRLYGELPFDDVDINPDRQRADGVAVWDGFSFHHGERWSLTYDGSLVWRWQDYEFESPFDHSELCAAYQEYRPNGGRLYINEHGHIYGNVPQHELSGAQRRAVADAFAEWNTTTTQRDEQAKRRLVVKRLAVTGDGDPSEGHLPLYLGQLDEFDSGYIPQPVVDDLEYYLKVGAKEQTYG